MKNKILLAIPFLFFLFLILFNIDKVPISLTNDEVSEVYNSYSLLRTGADRYALSFPLVFRSLGTYLAPLYTYLTTMPVLLFGLNDISARVISLLSGIVIYLLTYLIVKENIKDIKFSFVSSAIFSIAPWLIFFSRSSSEVTLALALFLLGIFFFFKSLVNQKFFPLATLILGISTHAYYSEKVIAPLFIVAFIFIFRKKLIKSRDYIVLGIITFTLTQIPFLLIGASALTRRFSQTADLNITYILARYFSYFSPRNLFFETDSQLVRSMPDLSVFFDWMIIPYLLGFGFVKKVAKSDFWKVVLILLVISPIAAAVTREPFYTIRVLLLLWVITLIIALGVYEITNKMKSKFALILISLFLLDYSIFSLSKSYLSLFRFERAESFGYQYEELFKIIENKKESKFLIDNSRDQSICLRIAYLKKYDPLKFQREIGANFLSNYFNDYTVGEDCTIENVEVRSIIWGEDIYDEKILVGDPLAISDVQVEEHKLKKEFEIKNYAGENLLIGYSTQPQKKCLSGGNSGIYCHSLPLR